MCTLLTAASAVRSAPDGGEEHVSDVVEQESPDRTLEAPGPTVNHPIWSRFLARFMGDIEAKGNAEHRQENLAGVRGRVIELGAGTGLNFAHYPAEVTELVATEPEPYMRERAVAAAAGAPVPVTVVAWPAEALAAPDASFDVGVVCLVLCCVRDQRQALDELVRVIRPGGELRYYEHVRADTPGLARVQAASDRIGMPRILGNEHFARRTEQAIRDAGFEVERERRFRFQPSPLDFISASHILGVARRPER
jgi:ubiquinone/menaquinone biosynthesis C-methylase UbiE